MIGTGNVASVLGYRLQKAGHELVQLYGRTTASVQQLAAELDTEACWVYDSMNTEADAYIIAVADTAIAEVAAQLKPHPKALVVHTAGSISINVLAGRFEWYGVLYPLQSVKAGRANNLEIPLLIDAGSAEAMAKLEALAHSLSNTVKQADDSYRNRMHVAAVFSNNFTNYLLGVAQRYCINENLDFQLLWPLIRETVERLPYVNPELSQTGPARRNDQPTITRHLDLLEAYPDAKQLYQQLTQSIRQWYALNK